MSLRFQSRRGWIPALAAALATLAASAAAASASAGPAEGPAKAPAPAATPGDLPSGIQAEPPPFTEGIFPCSQCHDRSGDPKRRELAFHDDVQSELHHGPPSRWCLDCHDNAKRDFLHLTNGELVPFTQSYRLCGQCHGDKYRDWRAGVHGKRVGQWNGQKTYFLCVNCHNPHTPKFKPLKPEPPPVPPSMQGEDRPPRPSGVVTPTQEKKP
jgi:hypothetical protein